MSTLYACESGKLKRSLRAFERILRVIEMSLRSLEKSLRSPKSTLRSPKRSLRAPKRLPFLSTKRVIFFYENLSFKNGYVM